MQMLWQLVEELKAFELQVFSRRHEAPVLIKEPDEVRDQTDAFFYTAFVERPKSASEAVAAAADAARQGSRAPRIPTGAVLPIRKREGAAFRAQVGVGRTANADVCVPLSGVSKYHAYFEIGDDGQVRIGDGGSRNGTFVDGRKVEEGESVALRDECTISIGPYPFRFYTPAGLVSLVRRMARYEDVSSA